MWSIDIFMDVYRIRDQSFIKELIGCIPNYPLIREIIWYLELTDQYVGVVDRIYCCHVTTPLPSLHQSICLDYLLYHRLNFGANFMNLDTCLQDNGFHNNVFKSWWRHQMETFYALLGLCAGNSPVPVNSPHKGQWRGALMFSVICAWINDWVNNREADDLRRHCGYYDVSVMIAWWHVA